MMQNHLAGMTRGLSATVTMIALIGMMTSWAVAGTIKTQTIEYNDGATSGFKGYLAYDDSLKDPRPGILIAPEWWGLTDYAKHRADMLAGLGYVAFVADMYGDGATTNDPKVAGTWAGAFYSEPAAMRRRAQAALTELSKQPQVDKKRLAAIGYCFGGSTVLELAREGDDLDKAGTPLKGVVSFHGGLSKIKAADMKATKAKLLIQTGADDPIVPMTDLMEFQDALKQGGVKYYCIIYSQAVHAFTNPDADSHHIPGIAYNAAADHRSWQAMKDFFTEIFPEPPTGK